MNVLLIVLDAVRADHLGAYGYARPTSPTIDTLAREGVRFTEAITPGARTWESFASILSGLYPQHHGMRVTGDPTLSPTVPLLPEVLRRAGYRTFARSMDLHSAGLMRGFDNFDLLPTAHQLHFGLHRFRSVNRFFRLLGIKKALRVRAAEYDARHFAEARRWLADAPQQKWFVLLRCLTAHWPYSPPQPYESMFGANFPAAHPFNDPARRAQIIRAEGLDARDIAHAIAHYDGGIRFLDDQLALMLSFLRERGLYDDTLIIVMSDHGEGLGEHGYYFEHGDHVYEHLIRVPLILRGGVPAGLTVGEPVQTVDLFQTILQLCGIEARPASDGISLLPLMRGQARGRDHTYSESSRDFHNVSRRFMGGQAGAVRTVRRRDGWKLVYTPRHIEHTFALYHLGDDPGELRDRAAEYPHIVAELKGALRLWLEDPRERHIALEHAPVDPAVEERLRALGYLD